MSSWQPSLRLCCALVTLRAVRIVALRHNTACAGWDNPADTPVFGTQSIDAHHSSARANRVAACACFCARPLAHWRRSSRACCAAVSSRSQVASVASSTAAACSTPEVCTCRQPAVQQPCDWKSEDTGLIFTNRVFHMVGQEKHQSIVDVYVFLTSDEASAGTYAAPPTVSVDHGCSCSVLRCMMSSCSKPFVAP